MKIRVLFVCLGNICRSPMAEAVMRHLVEKEGWSDRIEVDSAGTADWHIGRPPHEGTRQELEQRSISFEGMMARQVCVQDFEAFDYVVMMDESNLRNSAELRLESRKAGSAPEPAVFTFMELLPHRGFADVPDPYYENNFDFVFELVEEGCTVLLDRIKAEHKLQ